MPFMDAIKPWTCAACGERYISAAKTQCPKCYASRGSAERGQAPEQPRQVVKVYDKGNIAREFEKDAAEMAKHGYHVTSQAFGGESSRIGSAILFGPLALAAGRKAKQLTVVYERD